MSTEKKQTTVRITVDLPPDKHRALKQAALDNDTTVMAIATKGIDMVLATLPSRADLDRLKSPQG